MSTTTLSGKGQINMPAEILRRFGWTPGDKFVVTALDGQVFLTHVPQGKFLDAAGSLKRGKGAHAVSDHEIESAAMQVALERDNASRRRH